MQKIVSILGVVASVLFATAPQFSTLQPKTAAWLTLLGTVSTAVSGAIARFGERNIYITITGVLIAVLSVVANAGDLIPANITFILTVAGTAIAAFGKSLFNIGADPDSNDDQPKYTNYLIPVLLLGIVGSTAACDKSTEYAKTLDRVAGYVGTGLDLVEYQVGNGQLAKDPAIAITTALITVNEINGQLITETKKYVTPDGKSLNLDQSGKDKLLAIVGSSRNVATGLLANEAFTSIPTDKRQKYIVLINEITATLDVVGQLINTVKVQGVSK
jgi:hypothetical protein